MGWIVTLCTFAILIFGKESVGSQHVHIHGLKEPVNRTCPVDKKRANPQITLVRENENIAFCSRPCLKKFKNNKEKYLKELVTTAEELLRPVNDVCPVDSKAASPQYQIAFKGKSVAFCRQECVKAFNDSSAKYIQNITFTANASLPINLVCPVGHGPVNPKVTLWHGGNLIGFCCHGCAKPFKRNPQKYLSKRM